MPVMLNRQRYSHIAVKRNFPQFFPSRNAVGKRTFGAEKTFPDFVKTGNVVQQHRRFRQIDELFSPAGKPRFVPDDEISRAQNLQTVAVLFVGISRIMRRNRHNFPVPVIFVKQNLSCPVKHFSLPHSLSNGAGYFSVNKTKKTLAKRTNLEHCSFRRITAKRRLQSTANYRIVENKLRQQTGKYKQNGKRQSIGRCPDPD